MLGWNLPSETSSESLELDLESTQNVTFRGFLNEGNTCFINATLQAFLHILRLSDLTLEEAGPWSAAIRAINMKHSSEETLFSPASTLLMLLGGKAPFEIGVQGDAEEFLTAMLSGLHDELKTKEEQSSDNDTWFEARKNRAPAATRTFSDGKSPITHIFQGKLRSLLKRRRQPDSITTEPFFVLPLEIPDGISCVRDALNLLTKTETIENGTRQLTIDLLPPILIIQLKRFAFREGYMRKVSKEILIEQQLVFTRNSLSPGRKETVYRLRAVVQHLGRSADLGHYTAVLENEDQLLYLVDDQNLEHISSLQNTQGSPYLLFYQRINTSL